MTGVRAALVTGGSRGIGAKIAEQLVAAGWAVTISARDGAPLATTEAARRADSGSLLAVAADMGAADDVTRLVTAHRECFNRLDLLVLNAGMGVIGAFAEFPLRRLDRLLAVNVRGAYQLIQECLPLLRATAAANRPGARVVAVSSMTGLVGEPLNSAYGATKAALTSLCATLSTEESSRGVSATAICPGYVATDMTTGLHDTVPAEQMIEAADVASMVVVLAGLDRNTVVPFIPMGRPGPHTWQA